MPGLPTPCHEDSTYRRPRENSDNPSRMASVLAVISLDAVSRPLLDQMIHQGRLPHHAALLGGGTTFMMKPTPIHASIYRSLYTGLSLSTHGMHYPFQWCASKQRVVPAPTLDWKDSVFGRLGRAGRRMLVIDPPECGAFTPQSGFAMSGWQFVTRFVLPRWHSSPVLARELKRRFGPPRACHEVFGQPSVANLRATFDVLQGAPQRLVDGTIACLETGAVDFLWVTFVAAHIAGHQLWRESIDSPPAIRGQEPALLTTIYAKIDEALGRLVAALPKETDIVIFSGNGMGPETSLADLLPAMLAGVLQGSPRHGTVDVPTSPVWRLRGAVPTSVRARVAAALPEQVVRRVAARLEGTGLNWKTTRAFALPSDGPGFVRLNLKGRERDGIVEQGDAESLLQEIAAGLRTFVDPSGEQVVDTVLRPSDLGPPGPEAHVLPDLIVVWTRVPHALLRFVSSPRFGDVQRRGVGSGRAGNHPGATWAAVLPGPQRSGPSPDREASAIDIVATVCDRLGVPHDDLPGRSLFL